MTEPTNGLAKFTKRARDALGLSATDPADSRPRDPRNSRPGVVPSVKDGDPFRASNLAHLERRNKELVEQVAACPRLALVESLVEVPGRRRKMLPERYTQLVESLRTGHQIEPVVVERRADGKFVIISGHHRVEACRELGHRDVPIVVAKIANEDVNWAVFSANAIRAPLSDFEMFLGLREQRDRLETPPSLVALGLRVGFDRRRISELFAFERLPTDALALLESNPHAMGTTCAASLAKLAETCDPELIVQTVRLLAEGTLKQSKAAAWVKQHFTLPTDGGMAASTLISESCSYMAKGKTLQIRFKTLAERESAEAAIDACLRELSARIE